MRWSSAPASAAWQQPGICDLDVLVLEASKRVGGRVRSETRGRYWLNLGAHVFSGPGSATWRVAEEVGVELAKVPGELVAVGLNGRIAAGGRPELYPFRLPLELHERLALMRAWFRLRRAVAATSAPRLPVPGRPRRRRGLAFSPLAPIAPSRAGSGHSPRDVDALFRRSPTSLFGGLLVHFAGQRRSGFCIVDVF
jgi:oxygen-dependent protoporphyrinogen oxidase